MNNVELEAEVVAEESNEVAAPAVEMPAEETVAE